ncbi:MAG TPA: enoyl-CoA hydratase/isomerase family protein, partial [Myxococcota bacterium]
MSAPRVDIVEHADHAGVVTLVLNDEAKKNAMTEALGDALRIAVTEVRRRDDIRAVVLTGAG